jgi:hypothetical protein
MKSFRVRGSWGPSPILLVTCLLSISRAVWAETTVPGFAWERGLGAEQCPTESELREQVIGLLGRDPFAGPEAASVYATVEADGGILIAIIRARGPRDRTTATRELRSAAGTCTALANAVVLAIALALEDSAPTASPASPSGQPSPASSSSLPQAPSNAPPIVLDSPIASASPRDSASDVEHRAEEADWGVRVGALWNIGWLPRPNTGLGGALRRRIVGRVNISAGGVWLPAQSEAGQFSAGLSAATLGACVEAPRGPRFGAEHCVLGLAGAWRLGAEAGVLDSRSGQFWPAGGASSAFSFRSRDGLAAEIGIMGIVPFERPIFRSTSCPPAAFQQPFLAFGAFFSLGLSIW